VQLPPDWCQECPVSFSVQIHTKNPQSALSGHWKALNTSSCSIAPQKVFVLKDLATASHVFLRTLRTDSHCTSLLPLYTEPHDVLSWSALTLKMLVNRKAYVVSIDWLKPAFTLPPDNTMSGWHNRTHNLHTARLLSWTVGRQLNQRLHTSQINQPVSPIARQ
jgi:hypothetical protein